MTLPPWPTITLQTLSEPVATGFVAALQAHLGPLPQAELLEPWEPGDPWRVRIDVPELDPEHAELLASLHPDARIEAGVRTGARAARDLGRVVSDSLGGATLWSDAVEGGLCLPDLAEEAPEPAGAALASELVAAVRGVAAELVPDPGQAVTFVRHRPTGRRGVRVHIPEALLAPLSGADLLELREDVVDAIAGVVARRVDSQPGLCPDLLWDPRQGLAVLAWRSDAPGPALVGDAPLEPGLSPSPEHLAAMDPGGRVHALEVQVAVAPDHPSDEVALSCAQVLVGSELVGAEPRWVRVQTDRGVRWRLAACWRAPAEDPGALGAHLARLVEVEGVFAVRVVPSEPVGLEDLAACLDPAWRWTGARWVVRWRDGVRDRDRLVAWVTREADRRDATALRALQQVLGRVPGLRLLEDGEGRLVRPIVDDRGRPGLALHLAPDLATDALRLGWLTSALGAVPLPGWSDVIDLAMPVDAVVLHLWRRASTPTEGEPPVWVSVG